MFSLLCCYSLFLFSAIVAPSVAADAKSAIRPYSKNTCTNFKGEKRRYGKHKIPVNIFGDYNKTTTASQTTEKI